MLKVECESCKAPYQVDERRVPPAGLKMRCPKCGHTFVVTDPSKAPAPDSGDMNRTVAGVAPAAAKAPPVPNKPAPKPPVPSAPLPSLSSPPSGPPSANRDDRPSLPAVKPAPPRIAKPGAPPVPKVPAPPASKPALPSLDGLDLPSLANDIGLPAPVRKAPPPPPALPKQASGFSFEVDLPAAMPGSSPGAGAFGTLDSVAPRAPGGFGDFGAVPTGHSDLPSAKSGVGSGGGFGALDLPAPKGTLGDLPMIHGNVPRHASASNLPVVSGHDNLPSLGGHDNLPMIGGNHNQHMSSDNLPMVGGNLPALGGDLPSLGGNLPALGGNLPALGGNLPALGGNLPALGGNLPSLRGGGGFGEIDLPSIQNDLPQPMGADAHMPMPVSDDRLLPNRAVGGGSGAFGELDLPLAGLDSLPVPASQQQPHGSDAAAFGELDLPSDSVAPPQLTLMPESSPGRGGGGMAFGEVDIGGDPHGEAPGMDELSPSSKKIVGSMYPEASLEGAPASQQGKAIGTRAHVLVADAQQPRASRTPKVVAAAVALLVVGGAALQFTPVGAFGYIFISDKLHSSEYARAATKAADAARAKLALDTFQTSLQAADELVDLRRKSPRSRTLAAYAAFVEYSNQVRFGGDSTRAARAKTFLTDIPAGAEVPYLSAALAAQTAASGNLAQAKTALQSAAAREPKDGIQLDVAVLRGEIALAERDMASALSIFGDAAKLASNARTQFGLARVHYAMKNLAKAKDAVEATLAASPNHAGARTLRARLLSDVQHDDEAALNELATVLDEKARKAEGPNEISSALAAKGWILLGRDRSGDARAAFDEAVKIDSRNVAALIGQGEVLYADARYTEALTRYDEAAQKDPHNVQAIIGSAKTKIALERLFDAKAQLTAARTATPKEMTVALWLAKTEEALGNRSVAEKLYGEATDLADPQSPDALLAYSGFAAFLAAQGRTNEAQAKLEEARAKLPDTAALQRAFGDVAAAQGHFDEAIAHYESALEKNPNDLGTRFRLGVTYRKMRRLEPAAKEFDNIVAVDKEYPGIALERGLLFEESGDLQKALEQFQSASQKAPKDIDLMLRVGAAYVAIGKIDEALPLLNKVKDMRPNSAEASHFIGRAHLKQGGLESAAAMRYLQRAVELDPHRAEYHLYVAWAANEATPAQLGVARAEVEKALALDKQLADGYWQRGVVELRGGAINDAMKDLKHALELKPARIEAHAALAECYEQKNDLASAMAEWAKAIAGDDTQPMWRYRYGRLTLEKGQAAEAARHLSFAVDAAKKMQPRPGWLGRAAFENGEALRKTGQKQPAIDSYNLFLEVSSPTDPDRRDALRGLKELGAPYER